MMVSQDKEFTAHNDCDSVSSPVFVAFLSDDIFSVTFLPDEALTKRVKRRINNWGSAKKTARNE